MYLHKREGQKIELLESQIAVMGNTINILKEKCESNEQYSRHMSVRVVNIPLPEGKESADECLTKVKEVIN